MVLYIIYHQVLGGGSGGSLPQNDGRFGGVAAAGRHPARHDQHCYYDQGAYAQLLEEMVGEKQEVLADLALKARAFR